MFTIIVFNVNLHLTYQKQYWIVNLVKEVETMTGLVAWRSSTHPVVGPGLARPAFTLVKPSR